MSLIRMCKDILTFRYRNLDTFVAIWMDVMSCVCFVMRGLILRIYCKVV